MKITKIYKHVVLELRDTIKYAETLQLTHYFFTSSLATAKGTLARIDNPLKGYESDYPTEKELRRCIFNLRSSFTNKV